MIEEILDTIRKIDRYISATPSRPGMEHVLPMFLRAKMQSPSLKDLMTLGPSENRDIFDQAVKQRLVELLKEEHPKDASDRERTK